jgi:hypothetical protein
LRNEPEVLLKYSENSFFSKAGRLNRIYSAAFQMINYINYEKFLEGCLFSLPAFFKQNEQFNLMV